MVARPAQLAALSISHHNKISDRVCHCGFKPVLWRLEREAEERRGEAWGDRGALGSPLGDRGRKRVNRQYLLGALADACPAGVHSVVERVHRLHDIMRRAQAAAFADGAKGAEGI